MNSNNENRTTGEGVALPCSYEYISRLVLGFEELSELIPSSPDGESVGAVYSAKCIRPEDTEDGDDTEKYTLLADMTFKLKALGDECNQVFYLQKEISRDTEPCEVLRDIEELFSDIRRFLSSLEGKSHKEYLSELSLEREEILRGECGEEPPFDYTGFILKGCILMVTVLITMLVCNKLIPLLLK